DLAKGVFTYMLVPGKKGEPLFKPGQRFTPHHWRGPQAPPGPERTELFKGEVKTLDFESKALGGKRAIRGYLPPGHDRTKSYPVIYSTDGNDGSNILEPLITSGKVPPLIVVAASSGNYLGDRDAAYDPKKDLRSMEYLSGEDAGRYAQHETFFCVELPA